MRTLDHAAYPHILDLVLEYAPWDSKLALRRVSRSLRERVDSDIWRHIHIHPTDEDGTSVPLILSSAGDRLPAPPDSAPWPSLKHVRVADYYYDGYFQRFGLGGPDPLGVKVVRRPSWAEHIIPAATVVDVVRYTANQCGWSGTPEVYIGNLPGEEYTMMLTRRHVVNVLYDERLPTLHSGGATFDYCGDGGDVVFIFTPVQEDDPGGHDAPKDLAPWPANPRLSFVGAFLWAIGQRMYARYTLIGVDEMPPRLLGLPQSYGRAEIQAALRTAVQQSAASDDEDDDNNSGLYVEDEVDYLFFMARDEYALSVGEETFALETFAPDGPPFVPR